MPEVLKLRSCKCAVSSAEVSAWSCVTVRSSKGDCLSSVLLVVLARFADEDAEEGAARLRMIVCYEEVR